MKLELATSLYFEHNLAQVWKRFRTFVPTLNWARSYSSKIEFFSTPKSARSRVFRRSGTLCNKTLFRSPLFERNRFFLYSQDSSLEYFGDLAPYAIKHFFEVIFILDLGQERALVQCFSYLPSKGQFLIITFAFSHIPMKQV